MITIEADASEMLYRLVNLLRIIGLVYFIVSCTTSVVLVITWCVQMRNRRRYVVYHGDWDEERGIINKAYLLWQPDPNHRYGRWIWTTDLPDATLLTLGEAQKYSALFNSIRYSEIKDSKAHFGYAEYGLIAKEKHHKYAKD